MLATARLYLDGQLRSAKSFKVESKRADKSFPLTSIQLSQYVGGELHEAYPHLEADMHNPELTVNLEVRDYAAYVHADPEPGAGGLPVGMGGRAVSLLSGGIDSPVASWMMAKRGPGSGDGPLFQLSLHLARGKGEGAGPGPHSGPLGGPPHGPCGALYAYSGGDPEKLSR